MTLEMKAREWRDEGREEGMSNAFEIQSRLCDSLERAGRLSELPEALKDAQIREKLLREFGIVLS